MNFQFEHHYTVAQANALLPQIKAWFERLEVVSHRLTQLDKRLTGMVANGNDVGGDSVNRWVETLADLKEIFGEFQSRDIQVKDLDRWLIDFPSLRDDREIFLCWEKDEDQVEYWHEIESGYAGREKLG